MAKGTKEIMLAHANEWKISGMSLRDFAKDIGVTKGKLEYWVRKVENRQSTEDQNSQFIDISTLTENIKTTNDESQLPTSTNPKIVLTLPSGLVLKIYG